MNKSTNNQVPITNIQQPQDIKLAHGRGQKIPHPMGTETIELETSITLSTPISFVKIANIDVHNTSQNAINAITALHDCSFGNLNQPRSQILFPKMGTLQDFIKRTLRADEVLFSLITPLFLVIMFVFC